MAADGIICQLCGIEAPSRQVQFHQNIGALVMRFHRSTKGKLCKRCMHRKYWKMTGITLGVGWVGTLSIVLAPCLIIANTVQYLKAIGMPGVPYGARVPVLTAEVMTKLAPLRGEITERLNRGEDLIFVANDLGARVKVTPGQVVKYVAALSGQQRVPIQPQKTYGFPVVPLATPTAAVPIARAQIPVVNKPNDLPPPLIEI